MPKNIPSVLVASILFLCFGSQHLAAQQNAKNEFQLKNGISKPNTLATHPFGLLFNRLSHNFKWESPQTKTLNLQINSGNIWGQPVTVYVPSLQEDRERLADVIYYDRIYDFDEVNSPSDTYFFQYDGVLKDIRINYTQPLGTKSELNIGLRSFLLTKGKLPFTGLTGDQFIEWFHSNIAGGEDPFGRRQLGMDNAYINYLDRNGNEMEINAGDFVFSGIESSYIYYPEYFLHSNISLNFGAHLGINTSTYNQSLDLGVSIAGVKNFSPDNPNQLQLGLGVNFLRRGLVEFQDNQPDLGTSNYFGSFEGHLEYSIQTNKGGVHSFGLNYRIQSSYNSTKEEDYYVPSNPERIARWHEAARHLYKFPSYWSAIYTFSKKTEISIYLQQDMLVNNTPDIQTGVRLLVPLKL